MNPFIHLPLLALVLLGEAQGYVGKSFFLANNGSDSAAGTSPATAWRSFGRLANVTLAGGDTVYLRAGDVWHTPLQLQGDATGPGMGGFVDAIGNTSIGGWVVDCRQKRPSDTNPTRGCLFAPNHASLPPTLVTLEIDGVVVASRVANDSRPDLVTARAAPDPLHGFTFLLSAATRQTLAHGNHTVAVKAPTCSLGCGPSGWFLQGSPFCLCNNQRCPCTSFRPPTPAPAPIPVRVLPTDEHKPRPVILLDRGASDSVNGPWAVVSSGIPALSLRGIHIADATSGILFSGAAGHALDGSIEVADCVFQRVYNRSSVGQRLAQATNPCQNGWTPSVAVGSTGNVSVRNCLFDEFDVAFQGLGTMQHARFQGNTMTGGNGNVVFFTNSLDFDLSGNVFSRDNAPRYFTCGTTDIMIGGITSRGTIHHNEIGFRGEHPASPDGCGIDYEGGSDGVAVTDNLIHDSYGAGVMVFGLSDKSRKISNATIARNIFVRNGKCRRLLDDVARRLFCLFFSFRWRWDTLTSHPQIH